MKAGSPNPVVMGTYGIGVGRLMAAAIEQNHDDKGIIWPLSIAPYQVHICGLVHGQSESGGGGRQAICRNWKPEESKCFSTTGWSRPGVKFNDADLIGIPFRITISPRTLEGNNVEFKRRTDKKAQIMPLAGIAEYVKGLIEKELRH